MHIDIDVSGEDLFNLHYTICVAAKDYIKGFKMTADLIKRINEGYQEGRYRYKRSRKGRVSLKIRIYCVVVSRLLERKKRLQLHICRDFTGKEQEIAMQLKGLLGERVETITFERLSSDSSAHIYSYLMRKDVKDKMDTYVRIMYEDLEKFLL